MKCIKGLSFSAGDEMAFDPAVKTLPLPDRAVLPLTSFFGKMTPLVAAGDSIQAGQILAKGPDTLHPPLLSSVTGIISAIRSWPTADGDESLSLIIDSIEEDRIEGEEVALVPDDDLQGIISRIRGAGIREVEPSSWPVSARLAQPSALPGALIPPESGLGQPIDCIVINGMDTQPGLWMRKAALQTRGEEILECIPLLTKICGTSRILFAVQKGCALSDDFVEGIARHNVELVYCPQKYPLALTPVLVPFLTGKELPRDTMDSRSVGVVVIDVITLLKVLGAVRYRKPSLDVLVQITAPASGLDTLVSVREGTLLENILKELPPLSHEIAKVISGGPFLGESLFKLNVPITQETGSIILQAEHEVTRYANLACVNCGYCVRHCPMKLLPNELSKLCEYGKFDVAERMDLYSCIECGICAYVCPVNRPMVQFMRFGKRELELERNQI
jgi:H+/Na+-translocating ferredoxin:NAD+ oxidoreductase subunit C